MTITDLAEVMDAKLSVSYNPWIKTWQSSFKGAEEKTPNGFLRACWGSGDTPEKSILKYVLEIRGKVLVFDAYSKDRREFKVPMLDTERISE